MGPQVPGATLALRENLLPVLAGQTVHPVLLCLTVSHLLPQSYKLLCHLESLDVAQCVVALSSQYERHGVCGIVIFISTSITLSILLSLQKYTQTVVLLFTLSLNRLRTET